MRRDRWLGASGSVSAHAILSYHFLLFNLLHQDQRRIAIINLIFFPYVTGSRIRPKTLQVVDVPIIDNRQCEDWHQAKGINVIIYDEMMCAGYRQGGKDSCQVSRIGENLKRKLPQKEYLVLFSNAGRLWRSIDASTKRTLGAGRHRVGRLLLRSARPAWHLSSRVLHNWLDIAHRLLVKTPACIAIPETKKKTNQVSHRRSKMSLTHSRLAG